MFLSPEQFIEPGMLHAVYRMAAECGRISQPLGAERIAGAIVLPFRTGATNNLGGVVYRDGSPVVNSSLHEHLPVEDYPLAPDEPVQMSDAEVIYLGMFLSQWGHGLTDNLKRLWFLLSPQGKALTEAGVQPVYVADPNFDERHPVAEIIRAAGFDMSAWRKIEQPTAFKTLWNPDLSFVESRHGRLWAPEQAQLYERILANIPVVPSPYEKVYFSRTLFKKHRSGKEIGELQLEKVFSKQGFHIVHPELLSLAEQVNLLRCCRCFAATEGSVAHNAVWCGPEAEVVLLQKGNYLNSWQMAINDMRNYRTVYVKVHHSRHSRRKHTVGPSYICITRHLERFFGRRIFHLPKMLRWSWWRHVTSRSSRATGVGFAIPRLTDRVRAGSQ